MKDAAALRRCVLCLSCLISVIKSAAFYNHLQIVSSERERNTARSSERFLLAQGRGWGLETAVGLEAENQII